MSGGRRDGGNTGLGILIWKRAVNLGNWTGTPRGTSAQDCMRCDRTLGKMLCKYRIDGGVETDGAVVVKTNTAKYIIKSEIRKR